MKRIFTRTLEFFQQVVCIPFRIASIVCVISISFIWNGFNKEEWAKDWKIFKAMLEMAMTEDD